MGWRRLLTKGALIQSEGLTDSSSPQTQTIRTQSRFHVTSATSSNTSADGCKQTGPAGGGALGKMCLQSQTATYSSFNPSEMSIKVKGRFPYQLPLGESQ